MNTCPLCNGKASNVIYEVNQIPIFQNKSYISEEVAREAVKGDVCLVQCQNCGFVFNSRFDESLMDYNESYQNEQSHSNYFRTYLSNILKLLKDQFPIGTKVIEIGCGKGYFVSLLAKNKFNVTGFDPAYEGVNPLIVKDYFSEKYSFVKADLIVLRHTLEHIKDPFGFLHRIAKTNKYHGKVFIEVPCFDWIVRNKAFWDIFYEHCNYFNKDSLSFMFFESMIDHVFNGQYLYLLAELKDLKSKIRKSKNFKVFDLSVLSDECKKYKKFLKKNKALWVWGAGAKGSTFVNLTDSDRKHILSLIDINPKKQNRYVAKSAHKIISAEEIDFNKSKKIIIMNSNYYGEVAASLRHVKDVEIYTLGEMH